MRQDQYYDKMLTRLEKIETALNRIGRTLEAIQKADADSKKGCIVSLTDAETVHKYAEGEKE